VSPLRGSRGFAFLTQGLPAKNLAGALG